MKKILICMALACCLTATAHSNDNDTVIVEKPRRVRIISSDSLQRVEVWGSSTNPSYHYESNIQVVDSNYVSTSALNDNTWNFSFIGLSKAHKSRKPMRECEMRLGAGFSNAIGMPERADVQPFKSWEIWWLLGDWVVRPWRNANAFSVGFGLDWRNFRMTDDLRFVMNNRAVAIDTYPTGSTPIFSRIKVFSLNMPIRYHYEGRWVSFSLGPVVNLNTYGSLKTRYKLNGQKVKDVDTNVRVNPITIDFMGTVTVKGVPDIYFKYSPCNLLRGNYGPKFSTLSFGLMM